MSEVKAKQCDSCKKILQKDEDIHIDGVIKFGDNFVKDVPIHVDFCPICLYKKMTTPMKALLENHITHITL